MGLGIRIKPRTMPSRLFFGSMSQGNLFTTDKPKPVGGRWPGGKILVLVPDNCPADFVRLYKQTASIWEWFVNRGQEEWLLRFIYLKPADINEQKLLQLTTRMQDQDNRADIGYFPGPDMITGAQDISALPHEIGHTIGLAHEHTREDARTAIRAILQRKIADAKQAPPQKKSALVKSGKQQKGGSGIVLSKKDLLQVQNDPAAVATKDLDDFEQQAQYGQFYYDYKTEFDPLSIMMYPRFAKLLNAADPNDGEGGCNVTEKQVEDGKWCPSPGDVKMVVKIYTARKDVDEDVDLDQDDDFDDPAGPTVDAKGMPLESSNGDDAQTSNAQADEQDA